MKNNQIGVLAGLLTKKSRLSEEQKKKLWKLIDEYVQLCVSESWDGSQMPEGHTDQRAIDNAKKKLEDFLEKCLTC